MAILTSNHHPTSNQNPPHHNNKKRIKCDMYKRSNHQDSQNQSKKFKNLHLVLDGCICMIHHFPPNPQIFCYLFPFLIGFPNQKVNNIIIIISELNQKTTNIQSAVSVYGSSSVDQISAVLHLSPIFLTFQTFSVDDCIGIFFP